MKKDLCRVPPPGWRCTRDAGHDGPCAAIPARKTDDQGFNFERLPNGDVAITHDDMGACRTVIDAGIWASIVLTMTAFNERPNDWNRFMEHHQGTRDILSLGHPWNQTDESPRDK